MNTMQSRPPIERMLMVHRLLKAGEPVTISAMSQRLGRCYRVIQRDFDFMRDRLGLPLVFDHKANTWRYIGKAVEWPFDL